MLQAGGRASPWLGVAVGHLAATRVSLGEEDEPADNASMPLRELPWYERYDSN